MSNYKLTYQAALKILARRDYSVTQLREKLQQKFADNDVVIDEVIATLLAKKFLSNHRYAENYVRSRLMRGYGPMRIQAELRQRGMSAEEIHDALLKVEPQWPEIIHQVRCKKFGETLPETLENRVKQMRFLQYRGFNSAQIERALRNEKR